MLCDRAVFYTAMFIFHNLQSGDIFHSDQCHNVTAKLSSCCLWGAKNLCNSVANEVGFIFVTGFDLHCGIGSAYAFRCAVGSVAMQ